MKVKEELIQLGKNLLSDKLSAIEIELDNLTASSESETKSSMGDKYQTSREMITQERDKFESQKALLLRQISFLNMIDLDKIHKTVEFGSLVHSDKATYFICTALGKLEVEKKNIFVISANSPIAQSMLGKKVGASVQFNNQSFVIQDFA